MKCFNMIYVGIVNDSRECNKNSPGDEGLFLNVSFVSAILQKLRMRAEVMNWLRDQPFVQGMIIYVCM